MTADGAHRFDSVHLYRLPSCGLGNRLDNSAACGHRGQALVEKVVEQPSSPSAGGAALSASAGGRCQPSRCRFGHGRPCRNGLPLAKGGPKAGSALPNRLSTTAPGSPCAQPATAAAMGRAMLPRASARARGQSVAGSAAKAWPATPAGCLVAPLSAVRPEGRGPDRAGRLALLAVQPLARVLVRQLAASGTPKLSPVRRGLFLVAVPQVDRLQPVRKTNANGGR